VPGRI
jgi:hypothetical protein